MKTGTFVFSNYTFEPQEGRLRLTYRFVGGESFTEIITFPAVKTELDPNQVKIVDRFFRLTFLLAGVSYYKTSCPRELACEAFPIEHDTAFFIETVFHKGLGEFAYQNKMKVNPRFIECTSSGVDPIICPLKDHALLPIGGGKDSIVSLELLKKMGQQTTLFALQHGSQLPLPIVNSISKAGLPALTVHRQIDPKLIELNARGALNGHVPITAILSAIALTTATLQGYNTVIMSNENSSNTPTLYWDDVPINHQFSKSLEFEKLLCTYIQKNITPSLTYFSLLRPLTDAAIAERFAKLTPYHSIFHSCNKAFRQNKERRETQWCCVCPKCHFVFLVLAPFLSKNALTKIFGDDLLNNPSTLKSYRSLIGLDQVKPFECVGDVQETAITLAYLKTQDEWKDDLVINSLAPELVNLAGSSKVDFQKLLTDRHPSQIPERFEKALNAY